MYLTFVTNSILHNNFYKAASKLGELACGLVCFGSSQLYLWPYDRNIDPGGGKAVSRQEEVTTKARHCSS